MTIKRTQGRWYVEPFGPLDPGAYVIRSDIGATIGRVYDHNGMAKDDAKFIGIACRNHEELVTTMSLMVNSFMQDNPNMSDADIEDKYPHVVEAIKLMEKLVEEHKEEI